MRRGAVAVAVLLVVALLGGCAGAPRMASDQSGPYAAESASEAPAAPMEPSGIDGYGGAYRGDSGAGYAAAEIDALQRMVIRTADVAVVVEDADVLTDELSEGVRQYGGYVAASTRWYQGERLYARMTLRVPAESLDLFLQRIQDLSIRVERQDVRGQDVTEEYTDIAARLRNLEATETELLELLREVRQSRSMAEDVLAIHREVTNIRGQIESLKGRSIYLERMTALATVEIEARPQAAPISVVQETWNPLVTTSMAARTLVGALQGLAEFAIYVVVLSPLLLLPLGALWLLAMLLRRRKRKSTPAVT